MEIIILMIVFAVVGNIIKAVGNNRGTSGQPNAGQPNPREIFKELRERSLSSQPSSDRRTLSGSKPTQPAQTSYEASTDHEGPKERQSLTDYLKAKERISAQMEVISLDESEEAGRKIAFTQDALLSGIIFSEILKPPKAIKRV